MTKQELLTEFINLISNMQMIAVDIINDDQEYESLGEFVETVLYIINEMEQEDSTPQQKAPSTRNGSRAGFVDRDKAMQEIGEDQALMIFGEPKQAQYDDGEF
jgi:hypothetical protein